jgi:hypothetical protein
MAFDPNEIVGASGAFDPDQLTTGQTLSGIRSRFAEELKDPNISYGLFSLTHNEVGNQGPEAQKAFMETVFNRAYARKRTLAQTIFDRRYYPGISFTPSNVSEQRLEDFHGLVSDVVSGSNISNYATGNASGTVGFAGGPQTFSSGGERFGIEGLDRGWNKNLGFDPNEIVASGGDIETAPPPSEAPPRQKRKLISGGFDPNEIFGELTPDQKATLEMNRVNDDRQKQGLPPLEILKPDTPDALKPKEKEQDFIDKLAGWRDWFNKKIGGPGVGMLDDVSALVKEVTRVPEPFEVSTGGRKPGALLGSDQPPFSTVPIEGNALSRIGRSVYDVWAMGENTLNGLMHGLTSADMVMQSGLFAVPGFAEAFGAQVVQQVPDQYRQIRDKLLSDGMTRDVANDIAQTAVQDVTALLPFAAKTMALRKAGRDTGGVIHAEDPEKTATRMPTEQPSFTPKVVEQPGERGFTMRTAAPVMGGPGTPHVSEIPEPEQIGIKNAKIDELRMRRGWLPLMSAARVEMAETWNQAMDVLDRDEQAGSKMVDQLRDGTKTGVDAVDHALLAHERIRLMNERDMEAERASDPFMSVQDREEARVRWSSLEDRVNEVDQALRQAGTVTGRALQFRQALINDDYTFAGMERMARAKKAAPLSFEESEEIRRLAEFISDLESKTRTRFNVLRETEATRRGEEELGATRERVRRSRTPPEAEVSKDKILAGIRGLLADGADIADLRPFVGKLAEYYVRKGLDKLQPLSRALHETLKSILPDITEGQVRDLFSGYGDFRQLSKDQLSVQLRDLKAQAREAGKLRDLAAKTPPKRTGLERQAPSAQERKLNKLVDEFKKRYGADIKITDPETQLRSLNQAAQTRLKNQVVDMTRELLTGERPARGRAVFEYDMQTEKLIALRDQIRQTLREVRNPQLTDAQRLTILRRAAERNLAHWQERLDAAKQGVFTTDRNTGKPLTNDAIDAIKAKIEAIKSEVGDLREAAFPKKTPDERALQALQTRTFNRMAELQDRIQRGDFAARPRKPTYVLDQETRDLLAQSERLKREFKQGVEKWRLENRTTDQKIFDGISKWRRTFVLSWPTVFSKLLSASGWLTGLTPLEEVSRTGTRLAFKAVGLGHIPERAPRYGRGFSISHEVKAIANTWRDLGKAAMDDFKTGQSDLDLLYGDKERLPQEWKDYVGHIHKMLKEPARLHEFHLSFQYLMEHVARHGGDITDPMVQLEVSQKAYKYAMRHIFMEDNILVDAINRMMGRFKQAEKETGKPPPVGEILGALGKYELPVVKVPFNLVKRVFEYSPAGLVKGVGLTSWHLARALAGKVDMLRPEVADIIMRNVSRGALGTAFLAYGYFNADQFGGYYVPGRKKDDLGWGAMRTPWFDVPALLLHNPVLAQAQVGATIRKLTDMKLRKADADPMSRSYATMVAYGAVIGDLPVVSLMKDMAKALNPRDLTRFIGENLRQSIPGAIEWVAQHLDRDSNGNLITRQPQTIVDYWKMGIPGLRQQVPEKPATPTRGAGRALIVD